jgi:hypothetical protein
MDDPSIFMHMEHHLRHSTYSCSHELPPWIKHESCIAALLDGAQSRRQADTWYKSIRQPFRGTFATATFCFVTSTYHASCLPPVSFALLLSNPCFNTCHMHITLPATTVSPSQWRAAFPSLSNHTLKRGLAMTHLTF